MDILLRNAYFIGVLELFVFFVMLIRCYQNKVFTFSAQNRGQSNDVEILVCL